MRQQTMPGALAGRLVAAALAATFFAGCVADIDDDPHDLLNRFMRIVGASGGSGGSITCLPVSSANLGQPCMIVRFAFGDFRCDPTQMTLIHYEFSTLLGPSPLPTDDGQRPRDAADNPTGGHYVRCDFAMMWAIHASSMLPDSRVRAAGFHGGHTTTSTCDMGLAGRCVTAGYVEGRLEFDGPGEEIVLRGLLEATIDHPAIEGGSASLDIDLTLRT